MIRQLPDSANLEHLKGQAKALLHSLRANDPEAIARLRDVVPQSESSSTLEQSKALRAAPSSTPSYRLADAQLAIAREYGFESWSKLKRHVVGYPERRDAFFAAIRAGDRDRVLALLTQDRTLAGARDPNEFGSTPINPAANRDDIKMIDLLLEYGADINARSDWWAGSFGALDGASDETSAYLLSRGATLTAHAAARLGMVFELRELLARNPSAVHERGGDGQYPLHFSKTPEIVDILLDAGADIDARDLDHEGTPLQNRILEEPVARRLFERGATPDVFSAAALGEVDLLSRLLDEDPRAITRRTGEAGNPWIPQAPGRHIYTYNIGNVQLHQTATNLGRDAVYQLLWQRSTPAMRLPMAGWRGDQDAALEVERENPGIVGRLTSADMQMLPDAAYKGRLKTVRLLLEIGFDVNVRGGEQMTAIHWAAFLGFDEVIEAILPYKPDLTLKNVYGGTPLGTCLYGSEHGWRKEGNFARSVELLIEAGSELPEKARGPAEIVAVLARYGVS